MSLLKSLKLNLLMAKRDKLFEKIERENEKDNPDYNKIADWQKQANKLDDEIDDLVAELTK